MTSISNKDLAILQRNGQVNDPLPHVVEQLSKWVQQKHLFLPETYKTLCNDNLAGGCKSGNYCSNAHSVAVQVIANLQYNPAWKTSDCLNGKRCRMGKNCVFRHPGDPKFRFITRTAISSFQNVQPQPAPSLPTVEEPDAYALSLIPKGLLDDDEKKSEEPVTLHHLILSDSNPYPLSLQIELGNKNPRQLRIEIDKIKSLLTKYEGNFPNEFWKKRVCEATIEGRRCEFAKRCHFAHNIAFVYARGELYEPGFKKYKCDLKFCNRTVVDCTFYHDQEPYPMLNK